MIAPDGINGRPQSDQWRAEAACQDYDPDLWFPGEVDAPTRARAVAICRRCSVRQACLDYAQRTGQAHGIWGGVGVKQRQEYKIAQGRQQLAWQTPSDPNRTLSRGSRAVRYGRRIRPLTCTFALKPQVAGRMAAGGVSGFKSGEGRYPVLVGSIPIRLR